MTESPRAQIVNLDREAAATAQKIVSSLWVEHGRPPTKEEKDKQKKDAQARENAVTKALGVLQEHGVYAAMLYLYSRPQREREHAYAVRVHLIALLAALGLDPPQQASAPWNEVDAFLQAKVCAHLDTLLLVKQVWEQALVYARYSTKAAAAHAENDESLPAAGAGNSRAG